MVSKRKRKNATSISVKQQSTAETLATFTYREAKEYYQGPHIREIVEKRHVTLGWQHATQVGKILRSTIGATIGQYRDAIQAIPLAIGKIKIVEAIHVIEDHNCMHLDISVEMIAFDCTLKWKPLDVTAVVVSQNHIVGKIYDIITVIHSPPIPNIKKGESFKAKFLAIQFSGDLCQIKSTTLSNSKRLADKDEQKDC